MTGAGGPPGVQVLGQEAGGDHPDPVVHPPLVQQLPHPGVDDRVAGPARAPRREAVTGVVVFRGTLIKQLANLVLFGDNPSGEIFYFSADKVPTGGQDPIRRVMLIDKGTAKNLLTLIRDRANADGRRSPARADLRFGTGPDNQVFLLNKQDGIVRLLIP